jgi:Mg-chelatase subunit ChlD
LYFEPVMKDLRLFRLLREGALDADDARPLLEELAALPLEQRFPFLGVLGAALDHADEAIAVGAIRALAGADGPRAFQRLVDALSDPRGAVKLAAVEALRASCAGHPARWFHAVFHPEEAVRVAAMDGAAPLQAESFSMYLLADPACRGRALERLEGSARVGAPPALPAGALPVVLELVERGALSKGSARRLLAAVPWEDAARWLERSRQRSPAAVDAILDAAARPEGIDERALGAMRDSLDDLLDLFWEDEPCPAEDAADAASEGEHFVRPFWGRLTASLHAWPKELVRRVVAAVLAAASKRGSLPALAAGLCAVFHPRFLGFTWAPLGARYRAVASIYGAGGRTPRLNDGEVKALLALDLCERGPEGRGLDLWVVGGILHFLRSNPYKRLLQWVGIERVLAAFAEDPRHAAPLLCLKDDSKRGRGYILARIRERHPERRGLLLALLTEAAPIDDLEIVRSVQGGEEAASVLVELLRLDANAASPMRPKKVKAVASILGEKMADGRGEAFLRAWLDEPSPEAVPLGVAALTAMASAMDVERFVEIALALSGARLRRLLEALAYAYSFPFGKELGLAQALASHADEVARSWARARIPAEPEASLPAQRQPNAGALATPLERAEQDAIASASEADLPKELAPCTEAMRVGLTRALAARPAPLSPQIEACVALLGCHDPMSEVDAEFARFAPKGGALLTKLDAEVVRAWEGEALLPLLGHAWTYRWERHAFAFAEAMVEAFGTLASGLRRARAMTSGVLREQVFEAAASVMSMWRWRRRESVAEACAGGLDEVLVSALPTDVGEPAAAMLVAIVAAGVAPERMEMLKPSVARMLPDLAEGTRARLTPWVESRGLVGRGAPRPQTSGDASDEVVRQIRRAEDIEALVTWCLETNTRVVQEAALRLLELGEAGAARLLGLLCGHPPPPGALLLFESVPLWPEGAALSEARAIASSTGLASPEIRYRLAIGLIERGERGFVEHALRAARDDAEDPWFRPEDFDRLLSLTSMPETAIAAELAASPHPHAYRRSVERLLEARAEDAARAAEGLRAFLEAGTARLLELRRSAALWLHLRGDPAGFPVLLQRELEPPDEPKVALLSGVAPDLVRAAIESVLMTGPRRVAEVLATRMLDAKGVDEDALTEAYATLLADASSSQVRSAVVQRIAQSPRRAQRLRRVAEAFAWGVRTARELTGRLFKVEMVSGTELGYTRFDADRVFVTALPLLRDEPNARAVVEGLILHEVGHHMYHRGDEARAAWEKARKAGFFGLLNLVADEHLERNLRAEDASYGDRLKRLAAYAFQHSAKEIPVSELLDGLRAKAFEVLCSTKVELARREGSVRVLSGPLLLAMEREGMSFPRFMRALRMGLGDRHGDPIVKEALELFKGGFRRRSMPELLDVAQKLRALFGWEASLVESFGPHEELGQDPTDQLVEGEGITPEELQEEIDRILDPRKAKEAAREGGDPSGRRWINVSPDEHFDLIANVVRVAHDPKEHARYAAEVARHARRMRGYLEELGLALVPTRHRLAGKRFDRARTLAVVLRGDPRMLIARERRPRADLFLGVLIDCSGSMQVGGRIERAKRFGTLLAEAARGVHGVDVAVYGFTDQVIYDAGDASRCAAHALTAGGGNNDAGALWYAAMAARASRRRARLLVMISDGLPTECSAGALRKAVGIIGGRMGVACAQVAVQPLEEVCFPSYVVLDESDPDASVRRFGAIVARLVQKTLAGA